MQIYANIGGIRRLFALYPHTCRMVFATVRNYSQLFTRVIRESFATISRIPFASIHTCDMRITSPQSELRASSCLCLFVSQCAMTRARFQHPHICRPTPCDRASMRIQSA